MARTKGRKQFPTDPSIDYAILALMSDAVENGEGSQHGYGLRAILRLGRCVAIFNEHAPEEKYCRAAFAFAYLPTAVGRLLVGTETWVAA